MTLNVKYNQIFGHGIGPQNVNPQPNVFTASLSPKAVAANTTAEQTFIGIDGCYANPGNAVLMVNKPTAQAGLGIVGARIVGDYQVAITFINTTSASITPTSETYTFALVSTGQDGVITYNSSLSPVSVATSTTAEQTFTVTGLKLGSSVAVLKPSITTNIGIVGARVSAADTLAITYSNSATTAVTTPTQAETYVVVEYRPNEAANAYFEAALSPVSVATQTTAEQGFTLNGLTGNETVTVNKPSAQATLFIGGARASANAICITFGNTSTTVVTPTGAEVYKVVGINPVADPSINLGYFQKVLSPVSIASNTTAEQTFTVQGLKTGDLVIVNKPTAQAGIGLVGARVSAKDTLALTFANLTTTVTTPTASEGYIIGALAPTVSVPQVG